jgi:hypothetical protein
MKLIYMKLIYMKLGQYDQTKSFDLNNIFIRNIFFFVFFKNEKVLFVMLMFYVY